MVSFGKPRAAKGSFPYNHRTVHEMDLIRAMYDPGTVAEMVDLDELSRKRELTELESTRLEYLLIRFT
jgi:hypothetical protein